MDPAADIKEAFKAAVPIMLGYVAIGIPCGILSASIGLGWLQVLLLCALFYSGAGQFMIPNMWLALSSPALILCKSSLESLKYNTARLPSIRIPPT